MTQFVCHVRLECTCLNLRIRSVKPVSQDITPTPQDLLNVLDVQKGKYLPMKAVQTSMIVSTTAKIVMYYPSILSQAKRNATCASLQTLWELRLAMAVILDSSNSTYSISPLERTCWIQMVIKKKSAPNVQLATLRRAKTCATAKHVRKVILRPIMYRTTNVSSVHVVSLELRRTRKVYFKVAQIAFKVDTLNERVSRMDKDAKAAKKVLGVRLLVPRKSPSASIVVLESLVDQQRTVLPLKRPAQTATKVDTWQRWVQATVRVV